MKTICHVQSTFLNVICAYSQSPEVLFKMEVGSQDEGGLHQLTDALCRAEIDPLDVKPLSDGHSMASRWNLSHSSWHHPDAGFPFLCISSSCIEESTDFKSGIAAEALMKTALER